MKKLRQDAWTEQEDVFLAETVIKYITGGKTQLEAFKKVAKGLMRTPAACGYRWNAVIRKMRMHEIEHAKQHRKKNMVAQIQAPEETCEADNPIDAVIAQLRQLKNEGEVSPPNINMNQQAVKQLQAENKRLLQLIKRYEDAWKEMGRLWEWVYRESPKS